MTRREELFESYEDALFALLMDAYAEQEGQRLLAENERLRRDPTVAIPADVDARCRKVIRHAFSRQRRQARSRVVWRVLGKAAVVAMIAILLFTIAVAAIPELRVRTLNLLIEVSDVATTLIMEETGEAAAAGADGSASDGQALRGYQMPEIPAGYTVVSEVNNSYESCIQYVNDAGAVIYLSVSNGSISTSVDTEDATTEMIQIHGYDGLLIIESDHISYVWGDTDHGYLIEIMCTQLSQDIVRSMAEAMVFVG